MRHRFFVASAVFLVLGFTTPSAMATTITSHSCTRTSDTMRFSCHLQLSGPDSVRVGFRRTSVGGAWNWSEYREVTTSPYETDIVLYNFRPDEDYEYKAALDDDTSTAATAFSSQPELPTLLADMNWDLQLPGLSNPVTKFVMFDTKDCQNSEQYIVALRIDPDYEGYGYIAWYQDTGTTGKLQGWSIDASDVNFRIVWAIIDNNHVYEWKMDGTLVRDDATFTAWCDGDYGDSGPCPHHDVFHHPTNGNTYVLISGVDNTIDPDEDTYDYGPYGLDCTEQNSFMVDGVRVFDSSWSPSDTLLIDDMDFDPVPEGGGGPDASCDGDSYWNNKIDLLLTPIDWTHINSIFVTMAGETERWTISSRQFSEIIRYEPGTGVIWTLNGQDPANYGGFTIVNGTGISGPTNFGGQHDVTNVEGDVLMFDNRVFCGSYPTARAILVNVDSTEYEATITKSWAMRQISEDLVKPGITGCDHLGSATIVPTTEGEHALLDCGNLATIEEIDEGNGNRSYNPLLYLDLDDANRCKTSSETGGDLDWYRAFPLLGLGEF